MIEDSQCYIVILCLKQTNILEGALSGESQQDQVISTMASDVYLIAFLALPWVANRIFLLYTPVSKNLFIRMLGVTKRWTLWELRTAREKV